MPLPQPIRRRLLVAAGLCAAWPLSSHAETDEWIFVTPRARDYSRIQRKLPPTMAIEFGGQRVSESARWEQLSDAERLAVRRLQPAPLTDTDDPAYPRQGLALLTERLRVVQGPVGRPLRVYLQIDRYGAAERIAIDGKVSDTFASMLLGLLQDAAFKPGTCEGKHCTRVFAMDLVYLGEAT